MGFRRKFNGHPVVRLIVSVPVDIVEEVDTAISYRHPWGRSHPARANRSEFVRLAIIEKLARDALAHARACTAPHRDKNRQTVGDGTTTP